MTFWQVLYQLIHHVGPCVALTQSTHSTPATENPVVYGGSCIQSFLVALYSHGSIAWEFVS
jgi:hypothetical protein